MSNFNCRPSRSLCVLYLLATFFFVVPFERAFSFDGEVGVDGDGGALALQMTASDRPAMSFHNAVSQRVRFAQFNGSSWAIEDVATGVSAVSGTSLTFLSGQPHIFFVDNGAARLKHAYRSGTTWAVEVVDPSVSVGGRVSSILCGPTTFCVSYYDANLKDLRFAQGQTGSWARSSADASANDVGFGSEIVVGSSNLPVIVYSDSTVRQLKVAMRLAGGSWSIENVPFTSEPLGDRMSAAIDSAGALHVAASFYKSTFPPQELGVLYAKRGTDAAWVLGRADRDYAGGEAALSLRSDGLPE
ncbi:MAG: hypothetical protein IT290_03370, partial [Deltaproteobacteria bacterium]|nr:hypothetical protein [Deltaproteobacteria bacterium]